MVSLPVTPSSYIISIPLGLIAIASFVARHQEGSFRSGDRTADIQMVGRNLLPSTSAKPTPQAGEEPHPSQRLDHGRYGFGDGAGGGAMLGRDAMHRPLGGRPVAAADWLGQQPARTGPLPDIAGFQDTPPPPDPLAEPITSEAGYQITADEVSRLDMKTGRVTFNRNVRMTSPQFHLTCDQLVVHLGSDNSSMQSSEAHGSVNILLTGVPPDKAYRGQSSDAIFDPKKNQILLTGWPKVKGASQEQVAAESGTRMTLFTKTGRLVTEGRAQTRVTRSFVDESTGTPGKK